MNRTTLLTVSMVALLVLSGCLGGGGGDGGPTAPDDPTRTPTEAGTADGGDGDGGDGGGFEPAERFEDVRNERQMADYIDRNPFPVYRPGEYFEYEGQTTMDPEDDSLQSASMTIQSNEGGEWLEADIDVTLVRGDRTLTFTEEDPEMVFTPELSFTANGRAWIWIYWYNQVTNVAPRVSDLSVGDSRTWEGDDDGGLTFTVTEANTYAGIDCVTVVTEQFDGDERFVWTEACIAPDVGLPLQYAMFDENGDLMFEMELVDYRR